jgi:hypothetical protein
VPGLGFTVEALGAPAAALIETAVLVHGGAGREAALDNLTDDDSLVGATFREAIRFERTARTALGSGVEETTVFEGGVLAAKCVPSDISGCRSPRRHGVRPDFPNSRWRG